MPVSATSPGTADNQHLLADATQAPPQQRPSKRKRMSTGTNVGIGILIAALLIIVGVGVGYTLRAAEPIVATAGTPYKATELKQLSCKPGEANYTLTINGDAQVLNGKKTWKVSKALTAAGNYGDPKGRVGDITLRTDPATLKIVNLEVWNLMPPKDGVPQWDVHPYTPYEPTSATTVRGSNGTGTSEIQACVSPA